MIDFTATPPQGYTPCVCCGLDIISAWLCEHCHPETRECPGPDCTGDDECDRSSTWHCFTGHCDGSGCAYEGECEGAPEPV
jgi:hypothetical protein